jgi:hypothetical protein
MCVWQLDAILRETAMLEDEAAHAEATHEKMKDPLAVAEEVRLLAQLSRVFP